MASYYKHYKGGIYRLLNFAKHTETGEELVIYQAMYGKGELWCRPKEMFFEPGRFEEIPEEVALKQIPIELNPKYHFPDIEYTEALLPINDNTSCFSPNAKGMITLLCNKSIVPATFFDGFRNDDDLENAALRLIQEYRPGNKLEDIFHLIQVWGGNSGRGIYIFGDGYDWTKTEPHYKSLVDCCLSITDATAESMEKVATSVQTFNKAVDNMGVSFITKHTRFWLYKSIGNNAFPIYDRIMANCVMKKNTVDAKHLLEYWTVMKAKSDQLQINLLALERQIFKYAYTQR